MKNQPPTGQVDFGEAQGVSLSNASGSPAFQAASKAVSSCGDGMIRILR
jgi:hypothetical protein